MQDKTMMRFQYIPIRMARIKNVENTGGKIQSNWNAHISQVETQNSVATLRKQCGGVL